MLLVHVARPVGSILDVEILATPMFHALLFVKHVLAFADYSWIFVHWRL